MIRTKLFGIGLIFTLVISLGITGCESDDDDDTTATGGTTAATGGSTAGTGGTTVGGNGEAGTTPGGNNTFTGWVQDTVNAEERPAGMTVRALSNDLDLTPLAEDQITADDGTFSFTGLEPDLMCIQVVGIPGEDGRIDTFTCNVDTNEKDRFVVSTTYAIADAISGGLYPGEESNPQQASASGAVYYREADGTEKPVNCATVEVEPAGADTEVFYFAGALPDQTRVETDSGARFLAMKLDPGIVTLKALVNGEVIGSISLPLKAPAESTGGIYNSNITRIYADAPGDPTPDCTE